MRLVKLGEPRPAKVTLRRFGKDVTVTLMMQLRTFAQRVGTKLVYFRPFGVAEHMDKTTGQWEDEAGAVPLDRRASEVIMFGVHEDATTPYFVPRWINQLPSVIGSRKAEELNLEFFNSGGMPPVVMFIQGGAVAEDVRKQLERQFEAAQSVRRAAIVEIFSTGGSLDKETRPEINVQRFGQEASKDSLFQGYDARCEEHVRQAFRLPSLFLGRTDQANFAVAQVSYMIAEAQVFKPERDEFDAIINRTLMKELAPDYEFVSNPVTLKDVETQIRALSLVSNLQAVESESFVQSLNDVAGLDLSISEVQEPPEVEPAEDEDNPPQGEVVKKANLEHLSDMAQLWADSLVGREVGVRALADVKRHLDTCCHEDRVLFDSMVANFVLGISPRDPLGAGELMGCLCGHA